MHTVTRMLKRILMIAAGVLLGWRWPLPLSFLFMLAASLSGAALLLARWRGWLLWPLPFTFALLACEFVFRLHRLLTGAPARRASPSPPR